MDNKSEAITIRDTIEEVLELIDVFEARCIEREYTDTAEAWRHWRSSVSLLRGCVGR